jgi:hypothetical protein
MPGNAPLQEKMLREATVTWLREATVTWLRERLPSNWQVDDVPQTLDGSEVDGLLTLRAPNGTYTTIAIETKQTVTPRDAESMLSGLARSLRAVSAHVPLMIVAPWLSQRTREALTTNNINYLDLTGNALLRLENPAVYIQTEGAARNPTPDPRSPASLRGDKAARLVRLLADVRPPYGVGELARAASLTPGYVSRLLDALDREAIVDRGPRGVVEDVDVAALLRAWAASYDAFKPELTTSWLATAGAAAAAAALPNAASGVVVTGSFAAVRWAPAAAPALLVLYTRDVQQTATSLDLLPADEGANVILLRPFDEVAFARSAVADGVTYAAPSQVAADCLRGPGRMPAEGEALLNWMTDDERRWRLPSLPAPEPS